MLEITLLNDSILAFDGRVVEYFSSQSSRVHVRQVTKVVVKGGKKPRIEIYAKGGLIHALFDDSQRPHIDQLLAALNAARPGEIEFKY